MEVDLLISSVDYLLINLNHINSLIPFEYRPRRGPNIAADANAEAPPIK